MLKKITLVALAGLMVFGLMACETLGANKVGGGALDTSVPSKYTSFINECKQYKIDLEEGKKYIEETPKVLAEKVGLEVGASWQEVKDAIAMRLAEKYFKVGGKVEIDIQGGVGASAGTGGASAGAAVVVTIKLIGEVEVPPGIQQLFDAAKTTIERLVGSATKLKALAEKAPDLIKKAKSLAESAKNDIKNPAKAAEIAAELTGLADMFAKVPTCLEKNVSFTVEVSVTFSGEASTEAGAEGGAKAEAKAEATTE